MNKHKTLRFHANFLLFNSEFRWFWWSQTGSNRRPHACKARALPTELWPLSNFGKAKMRKRKQMFCISKTSSCACQSDMCTLVVCFANACRAYVGGCFTTLTLVGLGRFELPTSPLSGVRSNQLS